jgi:hypothetical protein
MTPSKKKPGTGSRPVATRSGGGSVRARAGAERPATREAASAGRAGSARDGGAVGGAGTVPAGPAAGAGDGTRDAGSDGQTSVSAGVTAGTEGRATEGGATEGGATEGGATEGRAPVRTRPAAPASALVVGTIPPLARVAGAGGLAAAVLLLVQPAFPLVREGGHGLGGAHNLWDFAAWLPAALLVGAAAALCLLGRLPRLGLAALIAAGGYGLGQLFRTAALLDTRGRSSIDLPLAEGQVRAFRYTPGPGLVLQVAALAVLAAALLLGLLAWRRTVMDDDGSFDPVRPTFAGMGFAGGLVGFAAVAFPPASPRPGSLTVAMPSLFERSGLDLFGGWLLIAAVVAVAVGAATVRPRLAVTGMFAGLAAMFGTAALGDLLLVIRSTSLDLDTGGVFQVAAAAVFAGLAAAAWRVSWRPARRGEGA